jgi:hypothetical protein
MLPIEDQVEKCTQMMFAEMMAHAKAKGFPPPILIQQVVWRPRKIEHPLGKVPQRNKSRERRAAAAREAALTAAQDPSS